MKNFNMNFFGPRTAGNTMHSNRMFAMAIPMIIVGFFSYLARNYQFDDALIYLRYIKNFQAGFGLTFNPEAYDALRVPIRCFPVDAVSAEPDIREVVPTA